MPAESPANEAVVVNVLLCPALMVCVAAGCTAVSQAILSLQVTLTEAVPVFVTVIEPDLSGDPTVAENIKLEGLSVNPDVVVVDCTFSDTGSVVFLVWPLVPTVVMVMAPV